VEKEYISLLENKWPEEAFTKTKVVIGNPFLTKNEHLIIFYEDIEEDSTLIRMVKEKYPDIKELVQEEDDEDGNLPFIENIINTKKGSSRKRIYLSKVGEEMKMREILSKCKSKKESERGMAFQQRF
jgi:hypothetical protein